MEGGSGSFYERGWGEDSREGSGRETEVGSLQEAGGDQSRDRSREASGDPWKGSCPGSSSVQSLSRVQLFATPWTAARQASLSTSNSQSLLKLMSIESGMPSNHFILCCPLLLLPSIFPSIRVFSNESTLHMGWPKYWSFSFIISPSNEHPGLISFIRMCSVLTDIFSLM